MSAANRNHKQQQKLIHLQCVFIYESKNLKTKHVGGFVYKKNFSLILGEFVCVLYPEYSKRLLAFKDKLRNSILNQRCTTINLF